MDVTVPAIDLTLRCLRLHSLHPCLDFLWLLLGIKLNLTVSMFQTLITTKQFGKVLVQMHGSLALCSSNQATVFGPRDDLQWLGGGRFVGRPLQVHLVSSTP